jgi:hypothetical protein
LLRETLQTDDVVSVYSGKAYACCCGCSGKYWYNSKYKDFGNKIRGYPIEDEEVSDRNVKRILNIVKKAENIEEDLGCISTTVGKRWYIVHLKDGIKF